MSEEIKDQVKDQVSESVVEEVIADAIPTPAPSSSKIQITPAGVGQTMVNTVVGMGCGIVANILLGYTVKGIGYVGGKIGSGVKTLHENRKAKKALKAETKNVVLEPKDEDSEQEKN